MYVLPAMNPILPLGPLLLFLLGFGSIILALGWRSTEWLPPRLRWSCRGLRALMILFLILIALNPGDWHQPNASLTPRWAILIDRSASMDVDDGPEATTRLERARTIVDLALGQATLSAESQQIDLFAVAGQATGIEPSELPELRSVSALTDLEASGRQVLDQYEGVGRPLHGMVLLSDGVQVVPTNAELGLRARAAGIPIYPIPLGGDVLRRDLHLEAKRKRITGFTGQPQSLLTSVQNHELGDIKPTLRLLNAAGTVLDEREIALTNNAVMTIKFTTPPLSNGFHRFQVEADAWPGEDGTANNFAVFQVNVLKTKIRVLVAEGTPHWDSKFLIQLLRRQGYLQVDTIHRLTTERFFRIGESTDETNRTVSIQGGELGAELQVFPETAAEFAPYDVIFFGKGADYFLTPERSARLKEFIRDKGGAVVFARGKPNTAPDVDLESLSPVDWGEPVAGPFRWVPTRNGQQSGLFGDRLPETSAAIWHKVKPLVGAQQIDRVKGFARVLVEAEGDHLPRAVPALISRPYGNGVVLAVNSEGLWQWDFIASSDESSELYSAFWNVLLQWSATRGEFLPGEQHAVQLSSSTARSGEPVQVRVRRRSNSLTESLSPPTLLLKSNGEEVERITLKNKVDDAWNTVVQRKTPGVVQLGLAGEGIDPDRVFASLEILSPPTERTRLSADHKSLVTLAEASGGHVITPTDLTDLLQEEISAPVAAEKPVGARWKSSWPSPLLALLLVVLAGTEWGIRRMHGQL